LGKEHPLPPGFMTQTNHARLNMGQQHDWFAPEAMSCYFKQLHSRVDNFDSKQMKEMLYKQECEFEEADRQFHLIDDQTTSVIINWNDSMKLYEQLISQGPSYELMKKLAHYSVNIRKHDFEKLQSMGAIEEPFENIYAVTNSSFYKADTGLTIDNQWLEETFII
jgi:CRISPR-associated endonuclease/helicase Cas3